MNDRTILIVEDDPALMFGLRDNFEMRGAKVLSAEDGHSGLQAARQHSPDLILLDVMLPKMNGYEVCHQLRLEGIETPIIMLTAKTEEDDIVRGLNLGADDYVTKPFSIRELIARVNAFLRRKPDNSVETDHFGNCEFNFDSCVLKRDGAVIELMPKEQKLLAYFLHNRGRALTRDAILNEVWGSDVIVTERSVDRCVTTLRSKIEATPAKPLYLKTVREVGYRFEAEDE